MNLVRRQLRGYPAAFGHLAAGMVIGLICYGSFIVSLYLLVACLLVLGLLAIPWIVLWNRRVADLDRRRAGRRLGTEIAGHSVPITGSVFQRARIVLADVMTYREIGWLLVRAITGMIFGALAVGVAAAAVMYLTLPAWFWAVPSGHPVQSNGITISSWPVAVTAGPGFGILTGALAIIGTPWLADVDARLTRWLLTPPARIRLTERVEELSDTRTAALDAHGAELRRIERDLHDGAQARLVSIAMRLGMAERSMAADPESAARLLADARTGAEDALSELRDIVRGMYPPILADRGLDGAVAALAARCAVDVTVSVDATGRQPAAVEAAAYFVTAETLTNVAKHSGATGAVVRVRQDGPMLVIEVTDDGHGGANESLGSGLDGIRRRAEALDGRMQLWSPLGGPTVVRVELPCGS